MNAMLDPKAIAQCYGGTATGNHVNIPTEGHSKHDRGTSITVDPSAPDGLLVTVHNGGDPLAVKDRLRRDGFLPERAVQGRGPARPMFQKAPRPPGISYFEYQDVDGVTVCRKLRTDPGKKFSWQHPDGNGGWNSGRGCEALFYRLPDLIAAPADAVIYIAEGERKADKLASWGLVATSSKDLPDDLSLMRQRSVVILPDNDDEGARIADKLARGLEGIASRVAQVLLPGLPHKGDIMDWGGSASDLRELAAKALRGEQDLLPSLDLAEMARTPAKPKAFIVPRIAPAGEVTLFTGPGAAGKSLFAQQLATAIAAGVSTLGLELAQAPAIYMTCEDDGEQLHWRQEHICRALGVPMANLAGKLRLASLRGALDNELGTFTAEGTIKPTAAFHRLVATVKADGARVVILDNVAHLFSGNENDRGDVTRFINLLNGLAGETGAAIILVAHPNKSGDDYSGSTAWLNAVRSQVFMDRERDRDGNVTDQDARVLTVGKPNYTQAGAALRFRWHEWAFVLDEDLPADTRAEIAEIVRANGENTAFLRCLASATERQRAVSHNPGSNYAPKVFAVMPEGKPYTAKAFAAAMERLLHLGTIALDQPLWRGPNRVMKQGIRLAEICTDPPAPTPCTNPHETRGNPARFNPPISKDMGAGPDGPPPPDDDLSSRDEDPFDPRTWEPGL